MSAAVVLAYVLGMLSPYVVRFIALMLCRSNADMHRKLIAQYEARIEAERMIYHHSRKS